MKQLTADDPARIGPYRLIARLGEGGMGLVYLGRSEAGRTVAVKVVQAEYAGHPEFRRRFAREVAAARRVGGSWTAAVLDADPEAAVPWVATQYIPGPDLTTVVAEDFGPLPEHTVHTLANRLALALQAVHEAGLIHRDLKPSNVLVTVDGPRVIDFGIARAMDSLAGDSLHTRTGMLIGSPGFMSPEQVRGLELTPASDVFCLGAVLVYAATGRLLFGAADTGLPAHLFRIAEDEADLSGVPESLLPLVRDCLEKDPAKRPSPLQVAARTVEEPGTEWLPGAVLAQLGRHAARLLDYAPELSDRATAVPSDPRVPAPRPQPVPAPPAYAPTAPAYAPVQGFGPPPAWPAHPAPAGRQDVPPPHPRRWWGLVVIALAQLAVLLEATTFSMAIPAVQADLGAAAGDVERMFTAYTLAFGGLLLVGGHLADRIGRKPVLVAGLIGSVLASALAGSAGDPDMLVWARVLHGVAGALLTSSALALVVTGFTGPKERVKAFGIYAVIAGGGTALGMIAGGWLLDSLSWRLSLYAGLPLAVIALIGALTLPHDTPGRADARLDPVGVLLGTCGVTALTYGLGEVPSHGWTVPAVLIPLVVGALLLAAFLGWQTATADPFASVPPVKGHDRLGCFLALLLAGVGTLASFQFQVFLLQNVFGYAPAATGLAFLPFVVALLIGSTQVSARLLPRLAPRVLIVPGLALMAVGTLILTGLGDESSYAAHVLPGMLLTGFGTGMAFMPLFATATAGLGAQRSGAHSAAVTTAQHLGLVLGSALLSSALADRLQSMAAQSDGVTTAMLDGHTGILRWAAGGTLLAALLVGLMVTAKAPGGQRS